MFRRGIRRIIQDIIDVEVGEANDGFELIEILKTTSPPMLMQKSHMQGSYWE